MKYFVYIVSLLFFNLVNAQGLEFNMQDGQVNSCSGIFYDSGGPSDNIDVGGNYLPNEDFTLTICPDSPDNSIEIVFNEFFTENNSDVLIIYDGEDTSAPVLASLSGNLVDPDNNDPPIIYSSSNNNTSGCLTFNFTSNGSNQEQGWSAQLSCIQPCPQIDNTITINPSNNSNSAFEACLNNELDFNVTSNLSLGDPDNLNYNWDFGDGTTDFGDSVSHTYTNTGVYTVELVTSFLNCDQVIDQIQLEISETNPGDPINLTICTTVNNLGVFDLTQNDDLIIDSQSFNSNVQYFLNEQDAIDNNNPIQNPTNYQSVSQDQEIWFSLTNVDNNCSGFGSFNIESIIIPEILQTPSIDICHNSLRKMILWHWT